MASLNPKGGVLGKRLAVHLLRRCTYYVTKERITQFANFTIEQAVNELFNIPVPKLAEPIDPDTGTSWIINYEYNDSQEGVRRHHVRSWWLNEAKTDPSIGHRLMFFLHSNFTLTYQSNISAYFYDYLALLRFYAKGNFRELAKKVTTDNVMLVYLNNNQNNKGNPNENYAREFLELFTIGKGPQQGVGDYTNYTEYDIQQAARVLTGFKNTNHLTRGDYVDPDTQIPRGRTVFGQHDVGNKTFSTAFGERIIQGAVSEEDMYRELDDFVQMIFDQDATAQHICRKLYRYFVHRNITTEVEQDIISPLANMLKLSDYNLESTLKVLLKSRHFYDADDNNATDEIIGGLIKSPMELAFSALNFFNMEAPDPVTDGDNHYKVFYLQWLSLAFFQSAGFESFLPPDVSGYPAYYQDPDYDKAWFTSSNIIARYKLPEMLIEGKKIFRGGSLGGPKLDIVNWIDTNISEASNANIVVNELLENLLPEVTSEERKAYFLEVFLDDLSPINWMFEWQNYKETNDDSNVKIPLETLVKTIMYSQEFQTF